MPNQSDRRKLKAKRYDKFEDSQHTPINVKDDVAYVPQRVSKRANTELRDLPNKKRCYGFMHPPSSTVNLANNRLSKLKQNLQAGLKNPNVSTTESSVQTSSTNVPIREDLNVPVSTIGSSKNIYDNLSKWASPPDASSGQNSANNRMSRLKKVINESQHTGSPKFSDSSGVPNNSRPLTEISYTSPQCSVKSPKSQPFKNKYQFDTLISTSHSSNKQVNILNKYSSNNNNIKNFEMRDSNVKMGNIDKSSNNLSSRILKIRKNTEQLTSWVNSDVFSKSENINLPKNNTTIMSEKLLVKKCNPPMTNSNIINSRSSFDVQTDSQGIQNSSTSISNPVKLNRNFAPLINDNFNTLNNNSTINKPSNDESDIFKASTLSKKSSSENRNSNTSFDLLKTQKQISPISQRLKLNRQSFTSLSPTGDTKNRPCKLNNNLASSCTANNTSDFKTTPLSETILKGNVTSPSNKPFNSSTHLFDTQKQKSPISERLTLKRKSSTPLSIASSAKNVTPFTFKEPPIPILTQESLKALDSPTKVIEDQDTSNEYENKMKMTASWIINHQQFSNSFSNSPKVLEGCNNQDSLNASSGKSDAATHGNMDNSEEMEWTNAEPDNSIGEVDIKQENRAEKNEKLKIPLEEGQVAKIQKVEKEKCLCIIVDTNIFISELSKLTDILTLKISGAVQPLIYIPWMVVTELDELKDRSGDRNLKKLAFDAIKFINKALSEENPRIKGQSINDMGTQNHIGSSPDDKIMATCLQAVEKYESVILLSNDLNLKNKAMINNIPSSSANEIIMKIISKVMKTTKTQKIKQKMSILCSEIICGCAKDAYGDSVWSKMDMLSNPPWPFLECLKRFKKYWMGVFQEKVLKHFLSAVEKLQKLMTDNKDICDDTPTYVEFVKLSLNICIFLKDIEDYRGSVETVLNDITNIG